MAIIRLGVSSLCITEWKGFDDKRWVILWDFSPFRSIEGLDSARPRHDQEMSAGSANLLLQNSVLLDPTHDRSFFDDLDPFPALWRLQASTCCLSSRPSFRPRCHLDDYFRNPTTFHMATRASWSARNDASSPDIGNLNLFSQKPLLVERALLPSKSESLFQNLHSHALAIIMNRDQSHSEKSTTLLGASKFDSAR
jgi:hypothetical protein